MVSCDKMNKALGNVGIYWLNAQLSMQGSARVDEPYHMAHLTVANVLT